MIPVNFLYEIVLHTCNCILTCYSKGISNSALPYSRSVPTWLKLTVDDVKEHIFKLAKKGLNPSQIGECVIYIFLILF